MTNDDLEKELTDLKRRVKELESHPKETHFHYHQPAYALPYQLPTPYQPPAPYQPYRPFSTTTYAPFTVAGGNSW